MSEERGGPLEMLTILDLSNGVAGPYAAMLLGQLGATVIKVEHPVLGEASRNWGPLLEEAAEGERSLTYQALNACKLSLTLNYETPEGAAILRRLVEDADGIIEDHPSHRWDELGLGAGELIARVPRLVIVQVSGYGASGPYSSRPLTGLTLAASTGVLPPDAVGPVSDRSLETILGQNVFLAALAALWRAAQTEHGQVVDVSGMQVLAAAGGGQVPGISATDLEMDTLRARGLVEDIEHEDLGRFAYPRAPFRTATPIEPATAAPRLGEHTQYVLQDLAGYEAAEVESLRAMGIA